jgi:hypothetical protein
MLAADFVGEVESAVLQEKFFLGRAEYLEDHLFQSFFCHYFAGRIFQLAESA